MSSSPGRPSNCPRTELRKRRITAAPNGLNRNATQAPCGKRICCVAPNQSHRRFAPAPPSAIKQDFAARCAPAWDSAPLPAPRETAVPPPAAWPVPCRPRYPQTPFPPSAPPARSFASAASAPETPMEPRHSRQWRGDRADARSSDAAPPPARWYAFRRLRQTDAA